ncbi:unnamed protein product, partial [Prorocentrum cordatum]
VAGLEADDASLADAAVPAAATLLWEGSKGDAKVKVTVVNNHKQAKQWIVIWEGSSQRSQLVVKGPEEIQKYKDFFVSQAKLFAAGSIDKDGIEDSKRKWVKENTKAMATLKRPAAAKPAGGAGDADAEVPANDPQEDQDDEEDSQGSCSGDDGEHDGETEDGGDAGDEHTVLRRPAAVTPPTPAPNAPSVPAESPKAESAAIPKAQSAAIPKAQSAAIPKAQSAIPKAAKSVPSTPPPRAPRELVQDAPSPTHIPECDPIPESAFG